MSPELQRILSEAYAIIEAHSRGIEVRAMEVPGDGIILYAILPDGSGGSWEELTPLRERLGQIAGVSRVVVETARRE